MSRFVTFCHVLQPLRSQTRDIFDTALSCGRVLTLAPRPHPGPGQIPGTLMHKSDFCHVLSLFAFGRRGALTSVRKCQKIEFVYVFCHAEGHEKDICFVTFCHVLQPLRSRMHYYVCHVFVTRPRTNIFCHAHFLSRFVTDLSTSAAKALVSENSVKNRVFVTFCHVLHSTAEVRHIASESVRNFLSRLLG